MSSYRRYYLPRVSWSDVKGGVWRIQPYNVTDYFFIFRVQNLLTSAECIINTFIPLIIIFIYAYFSHRLPDMFIWLFSFLLLRNFIGGYHASSHIRCIILSSIVGILSIILMTHISSEQFIFKIILILVLFVVFLSIGPILQNESYNYMEKKIRQKAICLFISFIAGILLLYLLKIHYWVSLYIGTVSAYVLYIIEYFIRKYKASES